MSTTSEFRDVLTRVITEAVDDVVHTDMALFSDEGCADEILATPEMQAIRRTLREHCWYLLDEDAAEYATSDSRLPASVIEWVLGDE